MSYRQTYLITYLDNEFSVSPFSILWQFWLTQMCSYLKCRGRIWWEKMRLSWTCSRTKLKCTFIFFVAVRDMCFERAKFFYECGLSEKVQFQSKNEFFPFFYIECGKNVGKDKLFFFSRWRDLSETLTKGRWKQKNNWIFALPLDTVWSKEKRPKEKRGRRQKSRKSYWLFS
jgi:hypothetical protein